MRRFLFCTLFFCLCAFSYSATSKRFPTITKWANAKSVNWIAIDTLPLSSAAGWTEKYPFLQDKLNADLADNVWRRMNVAKTLFHQDNLWILTSANYSAIAAMIDVESAFDRLFIDYFGPKSKMSVQTFGNSINNGTFFKSYNTYVGKTVNALATMANLTYDANSESVRLADSVKNWYSYNSADWSEIQVPECPDRYLRKPVHGHQRADIRSEWVRTQSTIAHFHEATLWLRNQNDAKINQLLDDCEHSFLTCFERYVKGIYTTDAFQNSYSETLPMAIDILCVDYAKIIRERQKK